ncbi:hypothetical protein C8F01DRAFT_1083333 [Mycena amicta]|nr:hypothetical protein C8F01DRAFT_1083333 [Mycena amicta]
MPGQPVFPGIANQRANTNPFQTLAAASSSTLKSRIMLISTLSWHPAKPPAKLPTSVAALSKTRARWFSTSLLREPSPNYAEFLGQSRREIVLRKPSPGRRRNLSSRTLACLQVQLNVTQITAALSVALSSLIPSSCGHAYCYLCIRRHFQTSFRCPIAACNTLTVRSEPMRVPAFESALAGLYAARYPTWADLSETTYTFRGLTFPRLQLFQTTSTLLRPVHWQRNACGERPPNPPARPAAGCPRDYAHLGPRTGLGGVRVRRQAWDALESLQTSMSRGVGSPAEQPRQCVGDLDACPLSNCNERRCFKTSSSKPGQVYG